MHLRASTAAPSCLLATWSAVQTSRRSSLSIWRSLTSTSARKTDDAPSDSGHYGTLGVRYDASQAAIKNHFYALSKRHHPDHNRNDPSSPARFVRISEAYNVLGAPETRARYDRDLSRQLGYQSAARSGRRGSFFGRSGSASSSASASASSPTGPAGGRPASGLSRRRTAFRGPPPSFYAAGGWGQQWAKRARNAAGQQHAQDARQAQDAQHAQDNQHAQDTQHSSRFGDGGPVAGSRGAAGVGGFGPGHSNPYGSSPGRLYYWDRDGHLRTQEGFDQPRERTRKMSDAGYYREGGTMANFVAVAGVLIIIFAMPAIVFGVLH